MLREHGNGVNEALGLNHLNENKEVSLEAKFEKLNQTTVKPPYLEMTPKIEASLFGDNIQNRSIEEQVEDTTIINNVAGTKAGVSDNSIK